MPEKQADTLEEQENEDLTEEENLDDAAETDDQDDQSSDDDGEEESESEETEDLVVRKSGGTLPRKTAPRGVLKRIGRLTKEKHEANEERDKARRESELKEQQLELLKLQNQKLMQDTKEQIARPNPDDFQGGVTDPAYIEAEKLYIADVAQQIADKKIAQTRKEAQGAAVQDAEDSDFEQIATEHYARADKIGAKNYDDVEAVATGIFGEKISREIIKISDKAHLIFYFLGLDKNRQEAENLRDLLSSPKTVAQGVKLIGHYEKDLTPSKVKRKKTPSPETDEELDGGEPSAGEATQRRVDQLRKKVMANGDQAAMKKIMKLKAEAEKKGITIR